LSVNNIYNKRTDKNNNSNAKIMNTAAGQTLNE